MCVNFGSAEDHALLYMMLVRKKNNLNDLQMSLELMCRHISLFPIWS